MEQQEILVKSSMDGTMQPSLFYRAKGKEKRPLLVGLHTWSTDRSNQIRNMLPYAQRYNFHLLLPEFRGPNHVINPNCTLACGSDYAKQDIIDAIEYCAAEGCVDTDNVFLLGASGGGHMAMLMAGFRPDRFKAIASFVGITDLSKWSEENVQYRSHILACCNNDEDQMRKRSPMTYLDTIATANIKLFHGKCDPSVPVSHSIRLFNAINEKYPKASVYLDIFDGGHEMDMEVAMNWILSQYKKTQKEAVTG